MPVAIVGLGAALDSAVSGLGAAQQALAVLSNNVANVNTPNYSRQVVAQSPLIVAGRGGGVVVEDIERTVDAFFSEAARIQSSDVQRTSIIDEYYKRIQIFFGDPNGKTSINSLTDGFFESLSALATSPEQTFFQTDAVTKGFALAQKISTTAFSLEKMRFDADQDIKKAVDVINTELENLYTVNLGIQQASSLGQSKASLFDRRDASLAKIAEYVDINVTYSSDGKAFVGTPSGVELLSQTRYIVEYSPPNGVDSYINGANVPSIIVKIVNGDGTILDQPTQDLVTGGPPGTVKSFVRTGKLKGLLELRDTLIPPILEQLDRLADTFSAAFNAIHNDGSGFPPANKLVGTRPVTPNELHVFSGTARVGVINIDGKPPASPFADEQYYRPLNLKLSELDSGSGYGRPDMQTIVDEINHYYGPQTRRIVLGNMRDIKLAARQDSIVNGSNFTFDFELDNDTANVATFNVTNLTISGGGAVISGLPFSTNIAGGDRGRTGPGGNQFTVSLAGGGPTWTITADLQVTDTVTGQVRTEAGVTWVITAAASGVRNDRYTYTNVAFAGNAAIVNPATIQPIASAVLLNSSGAVAGPGETSYLNITGGRPEYGISIDELNSQEAGIVGNEAATRTNRGFSHFFELNDFFVRNENGVLKNSAINLQVRQDILDKPGLISTGELVLSNQPADPNMKPLYTYELGKGGNQVIKRLGDLQNSRITFSAVSTIPLTTVTTSGYISEIIGYVSSKTQNAASSLARDSQIFDGMSKRLESSKGVNIDEELANMIKFENAYTSLTKVINTSSELLGALLESI